MSLLSLVPKDFDIYTQRSLQRVHGKYGIVEKTMQTLPNSLLHQNTYLLFFFELSDYVLVNYFTLKEGRE